MASSITATKPWYSAPTGPTARPLWRCLGRGRREIPLVRQGSRFTVDFDALAAALSPRTRLLICHTPFPNPLGWVATVAEQQALRVSLLGSQPLAAGR